MELNKTAKSLISQNGDDIFCYTDNNKNISINLGLYKVDEPNEYIAKIDEHWYLIKMYKDYFTHDSKEKELVKERIANNWVGVPANENYSNIKEFINEDSQVSNKICSIELDDSLQVKTISILLNDFLEYKEGLGFNGYLLKVNEIIGGIKDKEIISLADEDVKGQIVIIPTIFGKLYQYCENEKTVYQTLENNDELVVLYDILSVVGSYSAKDGLPKFNNAEDEAKYLNYCRGKDILFHYYYDNKK